LVVPPPGLPLVGHDERVQGHAVSARLVSAL
jgi:hypothetical protein